MSPSPATSDNPVIEVDAWTSKVDGAVHCADTVADFGHIITASMPL
jgi:hypothetical protein